MPDNFFVLLDNENVRKIPLAQDIEGSVRNIFIEKGQQLYQNKEEVEFDGYDSIEDDEILYITLPLPATFNDVINNAIGVSVLNMQQEKIKSLFWYENNEFYFQAFDNNKLLQNKNVIFFDNNSYNKLINDAFVIGNIVNGVYRNNKFYFSNYFHANRIFSLKDYYREATNVELMEFTDHDSIAIENPQWFLDNSSSTIRKQVAILKKSDLLNQFSTNDIKARAERLGMPMELNNEGKIQFPANPKACKNILLFLNEQLYEGPITNVPYKTNSKRKFTAN